MFICENCNFIFDRPFNKRVPISAEVGSDTPYSHGAPIEVGTCPQCGAEEFEEAITCTICEDIVVKSDIHVVGDSYTGKPIEVCGDCYRREEYAEI
jgi:hypothetical protein